MFALFSVTALIIIMPRERANSALSDSNDMDFDRIGRQMIKYVFLNNIEIYYTEEWAARVCVRVCVFSWDRVGKAAETVSYDGVRSSDPQNPVWTYYPKAEVSPKYIHGPLFQSLQRLPLKCSALTEVVMYCRKCVFWCNFFPLARGQAGVCKATWRTRGAAAQSARVRVSGTQTEWHSGHSESEDTAGAEWHAGRATGERETDSITAETGGASNTNTLRRVCLYSHLYSFNKEITQRYMFWLLVFWYSNENSLLI